MNRPKRIRLVKPPEGDKADWNDELRKPSPDTSNIDEAHEHKPSGRMSTQEREDRLDELASLNPLDYDQEREAAAKKMGVRTSTLDTEVAKRRQGDESVSRYSEVQPWDEEVSGGRLLRRLSDIIDDYIILPRDVDVAVALWLLHAHAVNAARYSPILFITSPTKRCGKTNLLTLISQLVPKPLATANISPAAMFRVIEKYQPTIMVDEADTFLKDSLELRGVLNSGHNRLQAFFTRCEGDNHEVKDYSTWGPKAVASIGRIHPTLEDRSVKIELKRKLPHEKIKRLPADLREFEEPRRMAARWAQDNMESLRRAKPIVPDNLNDRARDNWTPLLAIAEACGSEWTEAALRVALKLSAVDDDQTFSIMLLEDLRDMFELNDRDNLASAGIAASLGAMEDRPWPEFKNGKPITTRQMARLLADFKVYPKQVRVGSRRANGYAFSQLERTFERYVPLPPAGRSDNSDKAGQSSG